LRTIPGAWLKRDDELSFGVSGTKYRKFASLIPFLLRSGHTHVCAIGGDYSNHLLAAKQLFTEAGLTLVSVVKKKDRSKSVQKSGNALLAELCEPTGLRIEINETDWESRAEIVRENMRGLETRYLFLEEGGEHLAALPGAMTLGFDLLRNEDALGFRFDKIVVDAGTGFTAKALIFSLAVAKVEPHVEIVAIGQRWSESEFLGDLGRFFSQAAQYLEIPCPSRTCSIEIVDPPTARSFGAVNQAVLSEILNVARSEGVLIDPIYGAKMFLAMREQGRSPFARTLMIHSGGALSLFGYLDQLKALPNFAIQVE
jgi:1-aminocyclopropane-1-carboxylate deaminase/D-cysteine desulfhydrase-like pyridoxal-dependent ACC family enzyme